MRCQVIAKTCSATVLGIDAHLIGVEVDGLIGMSVNMVGLADCTIKGYRSHILKDVRTVAELASELNIDTPHVVEAIQYRNQARPGLSLK